MSNAPERVWIDPEDERREWRKVRLDNSDTEYIRADRVLAILERAAEHFGHDSLKCKSLDAPKDWITQLIEDDERTFGDKEESDA